MHKGQALCALVAIGATLLGGCAGNAVDAVSKATSGMEETMAVYDTKGADVLIMLASSKGNSTAKIAGAIALELGAKVVSPERVDPDELQGYALIGFGSGIFDQMHHRSLLDAADRLPPLQGRKVFIFSTSGVARRYAMDHGIDDPHTPLRDKLLSKGCTVVGEFNCAGFNDNSFLKFFGGMNKGRPNEKDLKGAVEFAGRL